MDPGEASAGRRATWGDAAGPIAIAAATAGMLALTWRGWPDPVIDFGREVYVPWQLTQGAVLYRDIAYFNGPFSPYINAAWFSLAGVGLMPLVVLNIAIVAAVQAMLYTLLRDQTGRLAATAAGITFAVVFACGQFTHFANYNWICPYSHEVTHGIALALGSLLLLRRWLDGGSRRWLLAAGAGVGCIALTKAEILVAAGVAHAVALVLARRLRSGTTASDVAHWLAGFAAPVTIAWLALAIALGPGAAARGVLGAWKFLFIPAISAPFFANMAGLGAPLDAALRLLQIAFAWGAGIGALALVARITPPVRRIEIPVSAAIAAALLVTLWSVKDATPWYDLLLPLPLFLALAAAGTLYASWRDPEASSETRARRIALLALIVVCAGVAGRLGLRAWVGHYGFGLAAPGTCLLIAAAFGWVPDALRRRRASTFAFVAGALAVWVVWLGTQIEIVRALHRVKGWQVGVGVDAFRADQRGAVIESARRALLARTDASDTLTTLVDCEWLNFLTRRRNPSPYGNYNPVSLGMFGEPAMLDALREDPPDWIAWVSFPSIDYGARCFGEDYGAALGAWIRSRYETDLVLGPPNPCSAYPGVHLLRRRRP